MKEKPTFLSLFSGCGGMDAGFMDAGFSCLQAFDIDKKVVQVHNENLGNSAIVADLSKITTDQLLVKGVPDVIVAGSPCQGFSTVGRRELDDPRNSLLLHAGDIAARIKPKVFVAENVSGALAGEHKRFWFALDAKLRASGYSTKTLHLNASELGLAQRRARIIMLAWRGDGQPAIQPTQNTSVTLRQVLAGVDSLPHHDAEILHKNSKQFLIASRIKPGQKLCDVRSGVNSIHTWQIPEVFGPTTVEERTVLEAALVLRRRDRKRDWGDADPILISELSKEVGFSCRDLVKELIQKGYMRRIEGCVDLAYTFNGLYKRLSWDSVALTVDTKFGNPRFFLHPHEHRSFTVREAARIQGFPDWFRFTSDTKDSFKMIGNAVPPPMGRHIANCVAGLLS